MESERDRKIRERAYELWEQSGRPEGISDQHWLQAEQEYPAGSESPDTSASAGTAASPAKRTTRARSTASESKVEKPAAASSGAKRQTKAGTAKAGTRSDAAKRASPQS